MLAGVASAAWRSFGGKTTWSSDALQRRRQEPRGNTLHVLGHLVFHIQHPTENRSILPHTSGNCWTQHLYPPLAGNPFPFRPCLLSGTYSFSSRLQREFQEGGLFAWSWYHTLSRCRQGRFSFFLLLPVQVVTEAHFKHAGMGLLRVVTTCFGCTSFQEGVWNRSSQCELHTQHPSAKASTRRSFWARSQRMLGLSRARSCQLYCWQIWTFPKRPSEERVWAARVTGYDSKPQDPWNPLKYA